MRRFDVRARFGTGHEDGQALVLFVAGLVGFLGIVGLSIDVGHKMWSRTDQQKAADAAAIAAVNKYLDTGSWIQAKAEAKAYATENGYGASEVTVNNPPLTGPNAGNVDAVEVIITRPLQKYFIGLVYPGEWKAAARAVAKQTLEMKGFGVIALDPDNCNALLTDSNAKLTVHNGGAFVNSNCENAALKIGSNAHIHTDMTHVTGNYSAAANADLVPLPKPHQPPVPDPFADIPTPPLTNAPYIPPTKLSGAGPTPACTSGGTATFAAAASWEFKPGRYPCKIHLGANTTARFKTGNYVFEGGFEASSNNAVIWERGIYVTMGFGFKLESNGQVKDPTDGAPKGILLYNTCKNPCGNAGLFILNSNNGITATYYGAPYANILIWQDRNADELMDFNSNTFTSEGAVYAKSAHVSFNSNCNVPLQFVANTVDLDSNASIDVNVENLTKVAIKTYSFVE
jgi:Putative Flp pilus-assembly TadE/G-like